MALDVTINLNKLFDVKVNGTPISFEDCIKIAHYVKCCETAQWAMEKYDLANESFAFALGRDYQRILAEMLDDMAIADIAWCSACVENGAPRTCRTGGLICISFYTTMPKTDRFGSSSMEKTPCSNMLMN